ncbi:MAG: hypothetical protein COA69_07525 [Robiginitomaculum sp.]|nr:MAG: hypothetical protein COA69_07525 [Robiginitomaculum sp.]
MRLRTTYRQRWALSLRPVLLSSLFAVALGQSALAAEYGNRTVQFNIPASSGADAIEVFAKQTGLQFLFQSRILAGINTKALSGELSYVDGLNTLLEGSNVRAEFVAQDIVVLRLKPVQPQSPVPTQKLKRKPKIRASTPIAKPEPILVKDMIVVTARRRLERLHDHPGSVASFNAEKLEAARVNGVEDIVYRTANALVEDRPGADMNVFIRGTGTATNGSGTRTDTGIGLYYDGVYTYLAGSRIPLLFYDMERIEILKGPQGGLYGRNTVGGAIVAQSARPRDQQSAAFRAEIGEYASRLVDGYVNMPVNDVLSVRVSGYYQERDSYYTNINPNKTDRGSRTLAGRIRVRYQPSTNLDALFSYEKSNEDKGPVIAVPITNDLQHTSYTTTDGFLARDIERLNANIAWNGIDGVELRLIAGIANTKSRTLSDFNNLIIDENTGEFQVGEQYRGLKAKQKSIDLIAKSTSHGPVQWLAGISYFEDRQHKTSHTLQGFLGIGQTTFEGSSEGGIQMGAAFVDLSYDISDKLTLNTSLRYSDEQRSGKSTDAETIDPINGGTIATPNLEYDTAYNKFSPAISLGYDLNDSIMAYAKLTTGYQSGGINARRASNLLEAFGPSTAINYEAGIHSEWLDRRLLVNAAIFRLDQNNFQYQSGNSPFGEFVNEGRARTNGLEIDITGRLTRWLEVEAHYGYLDARTTDVPNSTFGDISGFRKFGIPHHTAAFGADIHTSILGGKADLVLNVNYTLVLDRFLGDFVVQLDDYTLFDVKAGIELPNATRFYMFAENLFNDTHIITPVTTQAAEISAPRLVGFGISKTF